MNGKWVSVGLLALCEVAALALWFSASAIVPALIAEFGLSPSRAGLMTSGVQAGFVAGTLVSAALSLADRIEPRRLFAASALGGAVANLGLLVVPMGSAWPVALRFVTGACLAGVYPVGMKMVAAWAERDLGLLIGILVGALCLGSGSPHLFNLFGGLDWRPTILAASASAALAAGLVLLTHPGPRRHRPPPFAPRAMLAAFTDPALRLAVWAYLGHMWELYAMWAWIGVFLDASFRAAGTWPAAVASGAARLTAFAVIGLGGLLGSIAGGLLADRIGRTRLTMLSMALSGSCALVTGATFGASPALVAGLSLFWGLTICADSAQFSAAVSELAPPERIGTMLTVQTCAGFLLTLVTIQLAPLLVAWSGWAVAFATLAIGPFLGVAAMARLRLRPEAVRLAGGRR